MPGSRVRTRLTVEQRRRQLIQLGMELFSTRAYEDIWIDEIADQAGISRGLLYHYFPTKRDFYLAVSKAAADEIRDLTQPDPSLPAIEQVRRALDAFLRKAEERSEGFLTAYRGALAADPEVRRIVETSRVFQSERVLAALGRRDPTPLLQIAVRGWVAFVQDVTAQWLQQRALGREGMLDMLVATLEGAIAGAS
jgi:AcrR family transcriptional regulator